MRTTLINTTFWKEDSIDELHLDSKLLYLYMLTNPEKGLANIYHYKPKVISAYSGLSPEQVEIAVKQLIDLGYVDIYEGFYALLKGHEMAKKGRFTDKTIEKEKELIPEQVLEHFNLLINQSSSGVAPEHIDKDNNKDKSIDKTINKSNVEINELFELWEDVVGYKISGNKIKNRQACKTLITQHTRLGVEGLIRGVAKALEDKYAPRISDFVTLRYKANDLIAWGKRTTIQPKILVIE